ncbi:MAG: efflux RND transporter periplasmic adaptor subunit [Planctomycetota bacterium]
MSSSKYLLFGLAGVGVIAAAGWALRGDDEASKEIQGATVERGRLRLSVVERGNLKAAESVDLKCEIEGQVKILSLIDEGELVEPGTVLCTLDTADLEERRVQQEITLQSSEASFVKAKQGHAIQQSQNLSDIEKAERALEFARADLKKYVEGDWPQEKRKAEEQILVTQEELQRAQQELEWSEKLAEKGFLEQTQLDADRLAKTRAEVNLNQAKRALELLEEFDFPRKKAQFDADVLEFERQLERVKLQAEAKLADFEAGLRSSEAKLGLDKEKLAKLDRQLASATLVAPVAGMVVYAVEDGGRYGGGEPLREGVQVREGQDIITIPSSNGFVAQASVHESVLEKVAVGQGCLVSVDAIPGKVFRGEVKFKAVLPDQNSWFANPDLRVYRTEVKIVENDPALRPGMSCSVEILVDELADATYVPVQAVFLDAGEPVCFVAAGGKPELRKVETGENNGKQVVIEGGVEPGEVVLLALPEGVELRPAVESQPSVEGLPKLGDVAPAPGAGAAQPGAKPEWSGARPQGAEAGGERRAPRGEGGGRPSGGGKPAGSSRP